MDPVAYYRDKLAQYGPTHQAVDCGSEASHRRRLEVLLQITPQYKRSILDVGCGYGRLAEVFPYPQHYVGIDLIPEMIDAARSKYPFYYFDVGDIAVPNPDWTSDYVVASGLFQFSTTYEIPKILRTLFALARKGVAVNFLRSGPVGECVVHPGHLMYAASELTPYYTLRADYLPNDFTLYLYKDAP